MLSRKQGAVEVEIYIYIYLETGGCYYAAKGSMGSKGSMEI